MKELNPYQAPDSERQVRPFVARFGDATKRAYRAFRRGMKEDELTCFQTCSMWLGLMLLTLVLTIALISWMVELYWQRTR